MNDVTKNVLIGLFVVAATAIIIFVLLFLHPTVGDEAKQIRVRFANVDKVNVGTRVTYGGKPVGEVIEIKDIENPEEARKPARGGYVYLYELTLAVDSKVNIYDTDEILARTSGLLGEKSVEITPKAAKPGLPPRVVTSELIYANESGSVEETLKEFKDLSDKLEGALDSFKFALDELNRTNLWSKLSNTAQNLSDITTALNKPEMWDQTLENVEVTSKNLNEITTTLNKPEKLHSTLENVEEASRNINSSSKNINSITTTLNQPEKWENTLNNLEKITTSSSLITDSVSQGRGTLGSILMRDDLYLRTTSLMSKGETILDDIGHYGILFQNDKRWQRLRARRANLITSLSNPQEFRNYFNDELDEITSSLSRLSMVLQDTECCEDYQAFMDDAEFRKVFAELMRRVIMMEESLKLYNQQVVDRDVCETELRN